MGDRWAVWRAGLTGPRVRGFIWQPEPSFAGSEARGRQLMAGNLVLGGHLVELGGRLPWEVPPPNEGFLEALHGFDWLDDLASVPGARAARRRRIGCRAGSWRFGRGRGRDGRPT